MRNFIFGFLLLALWAGPASAEKPVHGGGTDGFMGQNLGVLQGDKYSDAWGVNSSGHVVGRSYDSSARSTALIKAFYWDGAMHQLLPATEAPVGEPAWHSEAWAISSGSPEIAVGVEERTVCVPDPDDATQQICLHEQYPVIWDAVDADVAAGASPQAVRLAEQPGRAFGINDLGTLAVGSGSGGGAVWNRDQGWSQHTIVPAACFPASDLAPAFPDGHDITGHDIGIYGTALDVNDAGIVVGSLTWVDWTALNECEQTGVCLVDIEYTRAYVYFDETYAGSGNAPGTGRVLPTPGGYARGSAYAVSNVDAAGAFHVAGAVGVDTTGTTGSGIRWAVSLDADGLQADDMQYEVLQQHAWSQGVNDAGDVAGTTNSKPDRRGNVIQTATLFQQAVGYIPLRPPRGGSDSASRSMAGVGPIYVVGAANVKGAWTAARWVIP